MKRVRNILLAAFLATGFSAQSATVGGIELPKVRDDLTLNGAGLLRKGFFFKIYVGALYLEDFDDSVKVLSEIPKRIDIHYFHHTSKKHMIRVANSTLKKNLTEQEFEELLPKIEKLHNAYLNGKKGSYASIIYRPETGLTYAFDEKPVVTIDCDRFANAYFTIWLGENPSSKTVKEAMLRGAKG